MQLSDITCKIIETVTGDAPCRVKIDTVKFFKYIGVVRYLVIGHFRLAVALDFDVFGIVFADRYRRIYYIGYAHHNSKQFCFNVFLFCAQFVNAVAVSGNTAFDFLGFLFFALADKSSDLLRSFVSLCS